ncbi:MAG: PEP-CTERM sorting domain-containing protein, partial [Verrucomicrobiota bacterium]|nr:PEP-CTERM sorting domain-containing protein [Verrucomicrobiota bacterium]
INAPNIPTYDISTDLSTGSDRFRIYFGALTNSNPVVQILGSSLNPAAIFNVEGNGYHKYKLMFNASTGLADFWIDGLMRLNNLAGSHLASQNGSLGWSGYQHANTVLANWNEVSLIAVPEPSTLALFGLGSFFFVACRLHKRRLKQ